MRDNDPNVRLHIIMALRSLFALQLESPELIVAPHLKSFPASMIWEEFIQRHDDVDPRVRIACLKADGFILQTQRDEYLVGSVVEKLVQRIVDVNDTVRMTAIETIASSVDSRPLNIEKPDVIRHLALRIGESKKAQHREVAFWHAAQIYESLAFRFTHNFPSFLRLLGETCLCRYDLVDEMEK